MGERKMKCSKCPYYKGGYMWNGCNITGDECFRMLDDCTLVNDDGTVNQEELDKIP
jgi:hypothetical protein